MLPCPHLIMHLTLRAPFAGHNNSCNFLIAGFHNSTRRTRVRQHEENRSKKQINGLTGRAVKFFLLPLQLARCFSDVKIAMMLAGSPRGQTQRQQEIAYTPLSADSAPVFRESAIRDRQRVTHSLEIVKQSS